MEAKPVRKRLIIEPQEESSNDSLCRKMVMSGKILERMVNQNSCFEIAQGKYLGEEINFDHSSLII